MENKNIKKNTFLIVLILLIGLAIAGGTYAYLNLTANVTNGTYNLTSTCFLVDYTDNTQTITGTMFPSAGPSSGLHGSVALKINNSCDLNGKGTIKLHINSATSALLGTIATNHCEDKYSREILSQYTTQSACTLAGEVWKNYSENHCEDKYTLERLKEYTTQAACEANRGVWGSSTSALKYAVYDNSNMIAIPVSVGSITSANIGSDIVIYDNFVVSDVQKSYYIYLWLDGYLTDNTYTDLSFDGSIFATATQDEIISDYKFVNYIENDGTQFINTGIAPSGNLDVFLDSIPYFSQTYTGQWVPLLGWRANPLYSSDYGYWLSNTGQLVCDYGQFSNGNQSIYFKSDYNAIGVRGLFGNKGNKFYYNTTLVATTPAWSATTTPGNIYVFGFNNGNSFNNRDNYLKLYGLKMWNNGTLLKEFIPCYRKSDNAVGLYDKVNNEFYTKTTGSAFTYG